MKLYLETNDVIINDGVEYSVVYYSEKINDNVAILKRDTYCPYVVTNKYGHFIGYLFFGIEFISTLYTMSITLSAPVTFGCPPIIILSINS